MLKPFITIAALSSIMIASAHAGGCIALHTGALISIHEKSGAPAQQTVDTQSYQDSSCPVGQVAISRCKLFHMGVNGAKQSCKSVIIQTGSSSEPASAVTSKIGNIDISYVKPIEVIVPDGSLSGDFKQTLKGKLHDKAAEKTSKKVNTP